MHVTRATGIVVGGWIILAVLGGAPALGTGPGLLSAVSRKTHARAGDFDINLALAPPESAGVEHRKDGPTQVILTFSEPIAAADGTPDCSEVALSSGSCTGVSIATNQMTVNLTGAAQEACLTLTITRIQDLEGNPLTGDNDVHIRVLYGDRTGDGVVGIVDLNTVVQELFDPLTASSFPSDVNADGVVNIVDLNDIKQNVFHAAPVCTPPPPGMVLVPAGEFQMGDTFNEGWGDDRPVHAVFVDAFYMDRTEVTNQQYADALNWAKNQGNLITVTSGVVYKAGSGTNYPYCDTTTSSSFSRITWNGSTFGVVLGKENHPMVIVSWYGAVTYANWRGAMQGRPLCYDLSTWTCNWGSGYRLPTEAEWEKAARGGVAGRRFPWSDTDTIQHARANYYSLSDYWYDTSPTRGYHPLWGVGGYPYTSPVGFFTGALQYKADWGWPGTPTSYQTASGANGYGLYDMAGNVWEWCNDWYSGSYYGSSPYNNPRGPTSGPGRVVRGGGWNSSAGPCRVAIRDYIPGPDYRPDYVGFRCAAGT